MSWGLTCLLSGCKKIFPLEFDFCGRTSYENGKLTGFGAPIMLFHVVKGESPGIERHFHLLCLARPKSDLREAFQFLRRPRNAGMRIADVDFGDFRTFPRTGVLQREGNFHHILAALRCRHYLQIAVSEGGVRKSVAEGEQRLDTSVFVAAIAHKHALGVLDVLILFLWVVAVKRWIVFPAPLECSRKLAGRRVVAK